MFAQRARTILTGLMFAALPGKLSRCARRQVENALERFVKRGLGQVSKVVCDLRDGLICFDQFLKPGYILKNSYIPCNIVY